MRSDSGINTVYRANGRFGSAVVAGRSRFGRAPDPANETGATKRVSLQPANRAMRARRSGQTGALRRI
jgi:hypothetical protein